MVGMKDGWEEGRLEIRMVGVGKKDDWEEG